jgi:hypothetical protein
MKLATSARTYLLRILTVVAVIFFFLYTLFAFRHLIEGPLVTIEYPLSGSDVLESLIEVRGTIKNASHVSLNDRKVFTDGEGNLKEAVLLTEGVNMIRIQAEDRFGRDTTKELTITLTPTASSTATHLIPRSL